MTTKAWCTVVHALLISFVLSACSEEVSLCKEAMNVRSDQLKVTEPTRNKFLDECRSRGYTYTPDQWECIIKRLEQREDYDKAIGACAGSG